MEKTLPPTPRPRGRPALTDQHREAVLQAARDVLAAEGLGGLQARALARRAGLSVGSIYKLFGDIDELVRTLNRETHREFAVHHRAALDAISPDETDVMVPLMALARAYIDFVIANERRWAAVLETSQRRAGPRPPDYSQSENALFGIVETVIKDVPGFADPAWRAKAARAMWASVHGIVSITLPNSRAEDPAADTLSQIELIIGAVIRDAGRRSTDHLRQAPQAD
jgi:AcrR family transcriptional regulator